VATPDTPIESLMGKWALTRNAVKKRARVLGVELIRPDRHTCLWPGDSLELAEQLHHHLQAGKPVATFPGLPHDGETTLVSKPKALPVTGTGKIRPVVHRQASPVSTLATAPVAAAEQMAALVAALRPVDPLAVPDALARAADAGHWLSNAELGAVVGFEAKTVGKWHDGHQPRPGYRLERRQESPRAPVWWRVHLDP